MITAGYIIIASSSRMPVMRATMKASRKPVSASHARTGRAGRVRGAVVDLTSRHSSHSPVASTIGP